MSNPVNWFEIYVQDMPRAKAFYEAVFSTTLTHMRGDVDMFGFPSDTNGPGVAGALVSMQGFPSGKNSVLVYFRCDDCAIEADKAVKAGGRMQKPKTAAGEYGFIALVHDSEGNMIGLHSMK